MTSEPSSYYVGDKAEQYEHSRAQAQKWTSEHTAMAAMLATVSPRSVLDVPVGTGRFFPLYEGLDQVIGVDISDDMLAEATARRGDLNVSLERGDVTRLPYDTDSVDAAVCVRLLNLVPMATLKKGLEELARVSRHHIIISIRLHGSLLPRDDGLMRHLRHLGWRARGNLRTVLGRRRARPHREAAVNRILRDVGLTVVERRLLDRRPDGSRYYMLLTEVAH